jgi:hypothetical protein
MATKRKRTSLDALIAPAGATNRPEATPARKSSKTKAGKGGEEPNVAERTGGKSEIVRQTLYLPLPVFDQLRDLLFEEQRGQVKRRRMHDYFIEGINLLFKDRGLKSVEELMKE